MKGAFDTAGFFRALDVQRRAQHLTWRDVATKSGVSASTLTRISQGKRPDVDGLASLLNWSGLVAEDFIQAEKQRGDPEVLARVSNLFRADAKLTPDAAKAMDQIVGAAYEQMTRTDPSAETGIQE